MNTNALNRLIATNGYGKEGVLVCSQCGSLEIESQAWVNANYHTYCSDIDDDDIEATWCNDCQRHVRFMSLADFEKKMLKAVLGLPESKENSKLKNKWQTMPYLQKQKKYVELFIKEEK